jgi:hypothetical protein
MPQRPTFTQDDMIGLVTLNLVLRIVLTGMMDVASVIHILDMQPHNSAEKNEDSIRLSGLLPMIAPKLDDAES